VRRERLIPFKDLLETSAFFERGEKVPCLLFFWHCVRTHSRREKNLDEHTCTSDRSLLIVCIKVTRFHFVSFSRTANKILLEQSRSETRQGKRTIAENLYTSEAKPNYRMIDYVPFRIFLCRHRKQAPVRSDTRQGKKNFAERWHICCEAKFKLDKIFHDNVY
jgi:hypothetical protein